MGNTAHRFGGESELIGIDDTPMMSDFFASIDLGGTNMAAAFADSTGAVCAQIRVPTDSHEGPDGVVRRMAGMLRQLREQTGAQPVALGVGVPGLVDSATGAVRLVTNFPTPWRDVPLAEMLQPAAGCPVYLLNDARAATLGELEFGHGRTVRDMIYFGLGTGVGGGIVIDGKLRLGPLGAAGEIGHQTIVAEGVLCDCGNRGCLETLVSGPAITAEGVRLYLSGMAPRLREICAGEAAKVSPETMGAAARSGDAHVLTALQRVGEWLGIGAANLVTALHPELIVIGGGVSGLGDLLLGPVRATLGRRVRMFPTDQVRVECSALGRDAGLLGGIALARRGGIRVSAS